ncbi:MAG: GDSL-type esterase/lipase family protein [Thermoanaerobaculia bacterium]
MSKPSLFPSILAASLILGSSHALAADPIVFLAFGDSITEGYGDTSSLGGGYTRRLERWLDQMGYESTVENYGIGGETTTQGLSRIDDVLAGGGDYLLLMEGTNDISRRVSVESILFNLDTMARRAETLGIVAVHGTLIPRIPDAPVDSSNAKTAAVASGLRDLGTASFRAVADVFSVFEDLPNVFDNYYFYDPDVEDPVGHPNTSGYIEIGGTFLEALLPLLELPQIHIVPVDGPIHPGNLQSFQVLADESIERVEWSFGDGGIDHRELPDSFDVFYIYGAPGSYSVTVRGFTATGAVGTDSEPVQVTGSPISWSTRYALLPMIEESGENQVTTDLTLINDASFDFGLLDATYLPDISYDSPPDPVRFLLYPNSSLSAPEVLTNLFGLLGGRGALLLELLSPSDAGQMDATARLRSPSQPSGASGCTLFSVPESDWSAATQEISGISPRSDESATVHVTNLGLADSIVRLDLFDAADGYIGSSVFELPEGGSRQRDLDDIFRDLDDRTKPYRATFSTIGGRFAAGLVIFGHNNDVGCLVATP